MNSFREINCASFPYPRKISNAVFCDLDETYVPISRINRDRSGISELESYLTNNIESMGILIGWVTGSSIDSVIRKARDNVGSAPHFIACGLGSEFYWVRENKLVESNEWRERTKDSNYRNNVTSLVEELSGCGLNLVKQSNDYQGQYKSSFYLSCDGKTETDMRQIEEAGLAHNVQVVFSKCNPMAGDPPDSYDIDLIPLYCGKDKVVQFIREMFDLPMNRLYAFGDSFSDFPMLMNVGHGYLVANADPRAKLSHEKILNRNYCFGILDKIKEVRP